LAARRNHIEIAKLLIERGADVEAKDKWGRTPLYYACLNDNLECAELLIDAGADVGAKDRFERTPLDLAQSNEMRALLGGGL
jgi:ankyrin repeat protein